MVSTLYARGSETFLSPYQSLHFRCECFVFWHFTFHLSSHNLRLVGFRTSKISSLIHSSQVYSSEKLYTPNITLRTWLWMTWALALPTNNGNYINIYFVRSVFSRAGETAEPNKASTSGCTTLGAAHFLLSLSFVYFVKWKLIYARLLFISWPIINCQSSEHTT